MAASRSIFFCSAVDGYVFFCIFVFFFYSMDSNARLLIPLFVPYFCGCVSPSSGTRMTVRKSPIIQNCTCWRERRGEHLDISVGSAATFAVLLLLLWGYFGFCRQRQPAIFMIVVPCVPCFAVQGAAVHWLVDCFFREEEIIFKGARTGGYSIFVQPSLA